MGQFFKKKKKVTYLDVPVNKGDNYKSSRRALSQERMWPKKEWMKERGSLRGGGQGCQEETYKSDIIKERKCCASTWNVKHLLKIEALNVQCLFVNRLKKEAVWKAVGSQTIAGMWKRKWHLHVISRTVSLWDSVRPYCGKTSNTSSSTSAPKLCAPPSQIVRISDLTQAKKKTGT